MHGHRLSSMVTLRSDDPVDTRRSDYQDLKSRIHQTLLDRLDLDRLAYVKREDAEPEIRQVIVAILDAGDRDHAPEPVRARDA